MQLKKYNHVSEVIFIITLFSVFLISGVLLVLFGANIYQKTTAESHINESIRTSLSYITEKVHQCDHEGAVQVENHEGKSMLALHTNYGDFDYVTYIYYDDGSLKELFVKENMGFQPSAGDTITNISSFSINENNSLIHIQITDTNDQKHELYLHANAE